MVPCKILSNLFARLAVGEIMRDFLQWCAYRRWQKDFNRRADTCNVFNATIESFHASVQNCFGLLSLSAKFLAKYLMLIVFPFHTCHGQRHNVFCVRLRSSNFAHALLICLRTVSRLILSRCPVCLSEFPSTSDCYNVHLPWGEVGYTHYINGMFIVFAKSWDFP